MTITINHVGKNRATHCGKRYVTACGMLFAQPLDGRKHLDPLLDHVVALNGIGHFVVRADETCAQALARYFA